MRNTISYILLFTMILLGGVLTFFADAKENDVSALDKTQALEILKNRLEQNPNDATLMRMLGRAYYDLSLNYELKGDGPEAWKHIKLAEKIFVEKKDIDGVFIARDFMKGLNKKYHFENKLLFEAVYKIEFGFIEKNADSGKVHFKESFSIPFRLKTTGFLWGYWIKSSDGKNHTTYFVVETPGIPKKITGDLGETGQIQEEKKLARSVPEKFKDKIFRPFWFDEGDPLGKWKIQIYVDDRLVKTVEFDVH